MRTTPRWLALPAHFKPTFTALGYRPGGARATPDAVERASRAKQPIVELCALTPNGRVVQRLQQAIKKRRDTAWIDDEAAAEITSVGIASAVNRLRTYLGELPSGSEASAPCPVTAAEGLNLAIAEARRLCSLVASRCDSSTTGGGLGLALLRLSALDADVDAAETLMSQIPTSLLTMDHFHAAMAVANRNLISPDWAVPAGYQFAGNQFSRMARLGMPANFSTVAHLANAVSSDTQIDEVVELLGHLLGKLRVELPGEGTAAIVAVLAAVARVAPAEAAAERAVFCFKELKLPSVRPQDEALIRAAFIAPAAKSRRPEKVMSSIRKTSDEQQVQLTDPYQACDFVAAHSTTVDDLLTCAQFYMHAVRRAPLPPSFVNSLLISQSIATRVAPELSQVSAKVFNLTLKYHAGRDGTTYAIALNNIAREVLSSSNRSVEAVVAAEEDIITLLKRVESDGIRLHPDAIIVLMQFLTRTANSTSSTDAKSPTRQQLVSLLDTMSCYYLRLIWTDAAFMNPANVEGVTTLTSIPVNVDLAALGSMVAAAERTVLDFNSLLSYFAWRSGSPRRASLASFLRRGGRVLSPSSTAMSKAPRSILAESSSPLGRADLAARYMFESATDRFRLREVPDIVQTASYQVLDQEAKNAVGTWMS